ncbi:c-type cytochrome [Planctomicrobium sp. SH664]|uniref:c-type cytochrome n=1 Tax=Planctomicrobium sp. SH664 TaxID=3448125 RepID=UPI003F5AEB7E
MRTCVAICSLALLLAGCGKPQFSHRSEYDELQPYAQEYVRKVLETHFGTPTDMVVWDQLPLDAHLAEAAVTEAKGDRVTLELTEPHREVGAGTELLFLGSGAEQEPHSAWVKSWNEKTHTATLEKKPAADVAAGTKVVVGPGQTLVQGRVLYAQHCLHCHGVGGDGAGPTAQYLNPLPRDYRKGIFKFTSTHAAERASRQDLARVIENGIPGTYMPSFKLLSPEENHAIVEYVLWLAMRGEVEYQLVKFLSDGYSNKAIAERLASAREKKKAGEKDVETSQSIRQEFIANVSNPDEFPAEVKSIVDLIATRWKTAQEEQAVVVPKENRVSADAASIARGRKLYLSPDLNCVACHGEAGFGDGPQTYSITKDIETGLDNARPGLYDAWGHPIAPRNLHTGIFRGGRRPIDLYDRVHAGIKGTPMPAFGAKLKDQDIWDLVNYIYHVPFEPKQAGAGAVEAAPTGELKEVASQ